MTRTIVITGATSGLGLATARLMAAEFDVRLVLACRNIDKAQSVAADIAQQTGNTNVEAMQLDLASLASVRKFVSDYLAKDYEPLFGLLNNAGIGDENTGKTEDGFDIVFQTNHLGHFLLTNLLLGHMADNGRVFSVSSDMHNPPFKGFEWFGVDAAAYGDERLASPGMRYSTSKLLNLYFIYELNRRLRAAGSGIIANAFNPGYMPETNLSSNPPEKIANVKRFAPDRWGDIDRSPRALAELMATDVRDWISGWFFDRSVNVVRTSELSYSEENAIDLW